VSFVSGIRAAANTVLGRKTESAAREEPRRHQVNDRFARNTSRPDTSWWKGRPLAEARNAHATNTKEQFDHAIKSGANWLEGDIRKEINSDKLEMRHDAGHEKGDNLTLREWLERGRASGRGLKLDVKEGRHIGRILDEAERANIPSERLMFNLGDTDMREWGPKIRERFPNAILAVNPPSGGRKLKTSQVNAMIENAKAGGHPVTFVVKQSQLTQDAIDKLRGYGTISVWNSPGDIPGDKIGDVTRKLRAAGVNGVIDLRPPLSFGEKIEFGWNRGTSFVKDQLDRIF
jgi:hypothetical protein